MSSEGGGLGSERGGVRSEGGGRELVGAALVAVRAGWYRLVIVGCLSFVPCCRSFIVVRSCSLFARFASWASDITGVGRVQQKALAVNCRWAVNGGRVTLVGSVAIEDGGTYYTLSIRRRRQYRCRCLHRHSCHVACQQLVFICGSVNCGPSTSSIRGRWWSLVGFVGAGPRLRVVVVVARWS